MSLNMKNGLLFGGITIVSVIALFGIDNVEGGILDKPASEPTDQPTEEPTIDETSCGHGDSGSGENCMDGTFASWDFIEDSSCDKLVTQGGDIVGSVCVTKVDESRVMIEYESDNGYTLGSLHSWVGCDASGYPIRRTNNYPKFSDFTYIETNPGSGVTVYQFIEDVSSFDDCKNVELCDYCVYDEFSYYIIARANMISSDGYTITSAFRDGESIGNHDSLWAAQGELFVDVDCCDGNPTPYPTTWNSKPTPKPTTWNSYPTPKPTTWNS